MLSFLGFFSRPPGLAPLPLKRYPVVFSLNRLAPGVDNIHTDVLISPQVQNTLKQAASLLLIKHSRTENLFDDYRKETCENEKKALRDLCANALLDGTNRAKSEAEVQIDFLGQASLVKLFLGEIRIQYEKLIANIEDLVRTYELSPGADPSEGFKLKERLTEIRQSRNQILLHAGLELFQVVAELNAAGLRSTRESIFPPGDILPDHFFLNPMLLADNPLDDFFLVETYALFGQRSEDPDNYQNLKSALYDLLGETELGRQSPGKGDAAASNCQKRGEGVSPAEGRELDPWIMEIDNIEFMFDCFDTGERYDRQRQKQGSDTLLRELEARLKIQEKMLAFCYQKFKNAQLITRVAAAYEMRSVYGNYCPPMRPRQVREYLINPASRKNTARQLKARKSSSLAPLEETIRRIKKSSRKQKKRHLACFLKDFSRYHRDLNNCRLLKGALDAVNLVKDEKILILSRENRSLYEFLLPDERVKEEKPILDHVIIKADIRGSMDITHLMRTRGLNPASYFSLNFFDPISELLCEYGGAKEFIEGDAIILSIFEHEDTPQGWYGVARACGLAARMLNIVRQYNAKSVKHDLPILEFGIGVCYNEGPPTFLFDGASRIIISPAINLADRLSGCNKALRRRFRDRQRLFNLFVFQNAAEKEIGATADDLSLRYNVNGIELDPKGFAKLGREISLKGVDYTTGDNEKVRLYTGTVPTLTGKYQRLIVREADVLEIDPETMEVTGRASRKYYEVCTHPAIHEFIANNA